MEIAMRFWAFPGWNLCPILLRWPTRVDEKIFLLKNIILTYCLQYIPHYMVWWETGQYLSCGELGAKPLHVHAKTKLSLRGQVIRRYGMGDIGEYVPVFYEQGLQQHMLILCQWVKIGDANALFPRKNKLQNGLNYQQETHCRLQFRRHILPVNIVNVWADFSLRI